MSKKIVVPGTVIKFEGYCAKIHDDERRIERVMIGGRVLEIR